MYGPMSGNLVLINRSKYTVSTPDVKSRGEVITLGQFFVSAHAKCRDGWRCQGAGCNIRTGKTERYRRQ